MSVGHSRRTSRKPSPHSSGAAASASCRSRSTPSFSSAAASPMSCVTSESTSAMLDLEPVLALELAHDDPVGLLLDDRRRRHPVLRLVAAGVGVDQHRAVRLDHQQPQRLGQPRGQAAGVADLAAGDDQAHEVVEGTASGGVRSLA